MIWNMCITTRLYGLETMSSVCTFASRVCRVQNLWVTTCWNSLRTPLRAVCGFLQHAEGLCLCCRPAGQSRQCDERFTQLCEAVESRQLLTDALISHSVAALADSNDFFLFTETIRAATLAFSRDASVATNSAIPAHPRLIGLGKGGQRHGLYPPCGVVPPTWLSSLVAPLVYVFGDPEGIFFCTRALYCRHVTPASLCNLLIHCFLDNVLSALDAP